MTNISVVTSFSPAGYDLVGRDMVRTFKAYWPGTVPLICAYEGERPVEVEHGFDLLHAARCRAFLEQYKDNPFANGTKQVEGRYWKRRMPYNFRFDAYKFARKVFAIGHVARNVSGKLFWMDADVITRTPVPEALLHALLPDDEKVCCLLRPRSYSECGFVGYNLDLDPVRDMIHAFEQTFATGAFFQYAEWHDSHVFDRVLEQFKIKPFGIAHNDPAQPFDASVLGRYCTHLKGPRKHARKASKP